MLFGLPVVTRHFASCCLGREFPIHFDCPGVSVPLPSGNFRLKCFFRRYTAIQTLTLQSGPFHLGHIQPGRVFWRIDPLEPLSQAVRFFCGSCVVERCW